MVQSSGSGVNLLAKSAVECQAKHWTRIVSLHLRCIRDSSCQAKLLPGWPGSSLTGTGKQNGRRNSYLPHCWLECDIVTLQLRFVWLAIENKGQRTLIQGYIEDRRNCKRLACNRWTNISRWTITDGVRWYLISVNIRETIGYQLLELQTNLNFPNLLPSRTFREYVSLAGLSPSRLPLRPANEGIRARLLCGPRPLYRPFIRIHGHVQPCQCSRCQSLA